MFYFLLRELLINIPNLWRARREYRKALRTAPHAEPWIVWVSDILDEVNGVGRFIRDIASEAHRANRSLIVHTCSSSPGSVFPKSVRKNFRPLRSGC